MNAIEKRRFLRFKNESEVKLKNGDSIVTYRMKDFSAGGFKIDYVEGFEVGQILDVTIDFISGKFATQAKIKWQNQENGIGFEFTDIEQFS